MFVTPLTFHYIKFKEAYLLTEPINGSKLLIDHHWMIFRWCTFEFICLNVGVIIEGIYLIFVVSNGELLKEISKWFNSVRETRNQ